MIHLIQVNKRMEDICSGILLVDKQEGETSFDVVKKVRKASGVRKVGHTGTLDPFATGLLVVLLGEGTKLSPYLMAGEKHYRGTIRLGIETDTLDPTGRVVKTSPVPPLKHGFIKACALHFTGEIEQTPPSFSALKYQGKRAYALARKGIPVILEKRKVQIDRLEIESIDLPEVTIVVTCSGGTYLRSLAADLGERLGPGAHLKSLRRLSSGSFTVDHAVSSRDLESERPRERVQEAVIPLREALPQMEEIQIDASLASRIRAGHQPKEEELAGALSLSPLHETFFKLVHGDDLVAITRISPDLKTGKCQLEIQRVFVPSNP
jgi:tRNA pseudouridine55 synthase